MKIRTILCATAAAYALSGDASAQAVDPLTVVVDATDARRFVEVYEAAGGEPTAAALQAGYLDGAGRGVEIFTPGRIENADNLARVVAANPGLYRRGIDVCLPIAEAATLELRSIYLAMSALFPDEDLPNIHVVFGANNSGGTAASDAQVLGLEVICRIAETEDAVRAALRTFFAHETVHTLQPGVAPETRYSDPLLTATLTEGFADYIAWMVTASAPKAERDDWARANEAFIWAEFEKDRMLLKAAAARGETFENPSAESVAAYRRWHANAGSPPEGWPGELGYWVGRRICEAYVDAADDKRAAIRELLALDDPAAILAKSGYADRF